MEGPLFIYLFIYSIVVLTKTKSKRFVDALQVIMATNRIDILDSALLRPGRIDRKIEFPAPNEEVSMNMVECLTM